MGEHQQVHHSSHVVGHDSQVVGVHHSGHYGGYHKREAEAGSHGYSSGPVVMTRRTKSATSTPRRTPARSPSSNVRRLLTLPILRSVRRSLLLTVRKPMRRFIIAAMLSVTTLKLLL